MGSLRPVCRLCVSVYVQVSLHEPTLPLVQCLELMAAQKVSCGTTL